MSKKNNLKKLKLSNKKEHYKMYKSGKNWVYAMMKTYGGILGTTTMTTMVSADDTLTDTEAAKETDTSNVLATQNSTTIPADPDTRIETRDASTRIDVENSGETYQVLNLNPTKYYRDKGMLLYGEGSGTVNAFNTQVENLNTVVSANYLRDGKLTQKSMLKITFNGTMNANTLFNATARMGIIMSNSKGNYTTSIIQQTYAKSFTFSDKSFTVTPPKNLLLNSTDSLSIGLLFENVNNNTEAKYNLGSFAYDKLYQLKPVITSISSNNIISGTATFSGDTITITDGTNTITTTVDENETWTADLTGFKDGATLTVTESNGYGDTPGTTTTTFYDVTKRVATINVVTEGDTAITGTGTPGDTITITDASGNELGKTVVNSDGTYSVPITKELEPGEKIIATPSKDKVVGSPVDSTVNESISTSQSNSTSLSQSKSDSIIVSENESNSTSIFESESRSTSQSIVDSELASTSKSESESNSASQSTVDSELVSTSKSDSE